MKAISSQDELRLAVDACISIMKRLFHSARLCKGAGVSIDVAQKEML
jgi:hypothetical protein